MATTSFQQYKEMGESLVSGEKLQQSADRAERQAEREARDKEKEREEKPPVPAPRPTTFGESRPMTFQRGPIRCYNCNRLGHIAKDCRARPTAAMEIQDYSDFYPQQEFQQYPNYSQTPETEEADDYANQEEVAVAVSYPPRSTFGSRPSYPAQFESMKNTAPPIPKPRFPSVPSYRPPTPSNVIVPNLCKRHNIVGCEECFREIYSPLTQTHHCQALVTVCQDCGQQHPVITDACQSMCKNLNMPVSEGLLENQPVKVLRDSGCSTVVVRRSLVPEDKLTGQEERCILIDGTVRRTRLRESSLTLRIIPE